MTMDLKLDRLAIHYVDKKSDRLDYAPGEQDVDALDPTISAFLLKLVNVVLDAPETGATRSGRFTPKDTKQTGVPIAQEAVDRILKGKDGFFDTSKRLARHLFDSTPQNASPGILAVVRLIQPNKKVHAAILKIRYKDESFVKVLGEALTHLEVEHVQNMLLQNIQKGAISPHPERDDYDLKVIDQQATDDPAIYFAESFLGCWTKKSDEHQVKKLLAELQQYGQDKGLAVRTDKLLGVVAELQKADADVTTNRLAKVVQDQRLYGPNFQPDDFKRHIDQSDLGAVDIPAQRFRSRGKSAVPREYIYVFTDPKLKGLTISGPPETLEKILTISGDTATFSIQTTKNGFNVKYE
jgi:37-kD nucleoid-associated bacterial protein